MKVVAFSQKQMMQPIEDVVRAEKLHMHGHEHASYGTKFDRMIALHHFDNAVEILLKCVGVRLLS